MHRERAQSQKIHPKHHDKRHCPEDLTCKECCPCVEILKKQNKILLEKNQSWVKEKEDLIKAIMKLNKQIKGWQKREKQFLDMDLFKRKLRDEVKAEVEEKHKIDTLILKQKYENTRKERDQLERKRDQIEKQLEKIRKSLRSCQQKLNQEHQRVLKEQQENKKNKQKLQLNQNAIIQLKNKINSLQQSLKDKSHVISRLQQSLNNSQKNYLLEKAKNSDNQFEAKRLEQETKKANQIIDILKKQANKQSSSIQTLSKDKNQLGNVVKQLQSTIASYNALEGQLRHRILVTEDYALQKEIQVKHLQADYYSNLYKRSV